MAEVMIVGAGIAGLTAALRLLQRSFRLTLLDQDNFIGGKWGAHKHPTKPVQDYHEHCYHMFMNWYNNFWEIADELGVRDRFEPRHSLKYLRRDEFPRTTEIRDVGSLASMWHNLFSGVQPLPDMFIYGYSLIDLLATEFYRREFLDQYPVNGFMRSRLYATDAAASQHQSTLAKAFACPSYSTAASTYRNFIKYSFRHPVPMMWVLKGDCYTAFLADLQRKLESYGDLFQYRMLHRVDRIVLDADRRVASLEWARLAESPSIEPVMDAHVLERSSTGIGRNGDVILAIPHGALGRLIDEHVYRAAPELGKVWRLRSEAMVSVDLYFKKRLSNIPRDHVVLLGSEYDLTFIDNSQLWPNEDATFLNLVGSECDELSGLPAQRDDGTIDIERRETVLDYLITELRHYLPGVFDLADIDIARTYVQTNTGDRLVVNDVGSWQFRPRTTCRIPNLFIAGDFVQTPIDVVTIEGAVVSGLRAAEQVRQRQGVGEPIHVTWPDAYPDLAVEALRLAGMPYAYVAKLAALAGEASWRLYRDLVGGNR
jgi:NAD(P)-binding Rossmann-like domain/Flavin containing amine oxidoreductase